MRGGIKRRGGKPRWNLDGAAKEERGGEALKKLVPLILFYWKMPPERGNTARTVQYSTREEKGDKTPDIIQRNFTIPYNTTEAGELAPGLSE